MRACSRCSAVGVAGCAFGGVSCGSAAKPFVVRACCCTPRAASAERGGDAAVPVASSSWSCLWPRILRVRHGLVGDLDLLRARRPR